MFALSFSASAPTPVLHAQGLPDSFVRKMDIHKDAIGFGSSSAIRAPRPPAYEVEIAFDMESPMYLSWVSSLHYWWHSWETRDGMVLQYRNPEMYVLKGLFPTWFEAIHVDCLDHDETIKAARMYRFGSMEGDNPRLCMRFDEWESSILPT